MRLSGPRCRCLATSAGVLIAGLMLGCSLFWNQLFDELIATQLVLKPNSRSYNEWVAPNVPLHFDVFMFNWTNPEEFPDVVPNFEEIGPFSFRERREHVNVTWNSNGTVSYRTFRSWHFVEERSNASLDDEITTLNAIAASAVYRSRYWSYIRQAGISMGLSMFNQQISISRTARELLFEGFEDSLLDLAKSLPDSATGGAPPVDRFGWFYTRNNSLDTDGFVEVTTGEVGLPGQLVNWNTKESLPYFEGSCSKLTGTMGEFFPRNLTEESILSVFVPDLCRPLHLDYAGSGETMGMSYHTYSVTERTFDNSTHSLDNTCFCNGPCGWAGVMNVSACRYGSPAFISLPHFLHAEQAIKDKVTGLNADPEKHSFYFSVEPKLGVPLNVAARFQLNMLLIPNPTIVLFNNVPEMLFPLLWVEQCVSAPDPIVAELRIVRSLMDWGGVGCGAVAVLLIVLLVGITFAGMFTKGQRYTQTPDVPEKCEKLEKHDEVELLKMYAK